MFRDGVGAQLWHAAVWIEFLFGGLGVTNVQAYWLAQVGSGVLIGQRARNDWLNASRDQWSLRLRCCNLQHGPSGFQSSSIQNKMAARVEICLPCICSNPRYSWVTYFILSSICNFSQLVLSILSTHFLFDLSNFVTLSIFRRLIKLPSSSRPLLSIHFLHYHLTL